MSFQYASDLHLERIRDCNLDKRTLPIKPVAPYLLLAGDIGNPNQSSYWQAIEWFSKNWEHVFLVTGNHDYYKSSYQEEDTPDQIDQYIRDRCKAYPNVHFLQLDSWISPDGRVQIHGCTMWSNVSDDEAETIERCMMDYHLINGIKSIKDTNRIHAHHVKWLTETLAKPTSASTVIVLTHHLPSFEVLHDRYWCGFINDTFATKLDDTLIKPPVTHWIAGRSHMRTKHTFPNGIRFASNPLGYTGECTGFSRTAVMKFTEQAADCLTLPAQTAPSTPQTDAAVPC
jgi:hypothetical protein